MIPIQQRTLSLTADAEEDLIEMRNTHEKPYLRERAAAILKIADGTSPHAVAKEGLLQERQPDTVYEWLNRYEAEGIDGLYIHDGRGRKAAYEP